MRSFDFTPYRRSTVGFDRLFDLLDQTARADTAPNWPPYNIERASEVDYRITMALAGFSPGEIELVQKENTLFVSGQKHPEPEGVQVLHRGIATRAFKQSFNLADHVKVTGADLVSGLLTIDLVREIPEALKPRKIEISTGGAAEGVGQENVPQIDQVRAA